ncbi:hypothetical protein [Komagataeibacter rhaeticus]|uniref:hypothetical protein n=1 Tax=Komagataeibacter rhaeticus TaxID=215221 RepID=UPI001A63E473|nr:hypothetical protein [Komagataeibacter rhaeticus]MBL7239594.1 hypothetical protein [Komagataeibacter rhaeticus]
MFFVNFSEESLRQMCLSAIESYVIGDGKNKTQIETLSFIWGYCNSNGEGRQFRVETASECVSAKRTTHSVSGYKKSAHLKSEFMKFWSPELTFLGDFHTHPYDTVKEVKSEKGFEFSEEDFYSFLNDDDLWNKTENPVMIVMAICKMQKVKEHNLEYIGSGTNIAVFSVAQFRFWINVSVGYINENGDRCTTGNYSDDVILLNPMMRFWNPSGIKIDGL